MAKLTLTNPTDDELNATFAVEIAGWRDVRFEEGEDVNIDAREIYPWEGMAGWPPDGQKRRLIPRWTAHFDTILPWIKERCVVRYSLTTGWRWEVMAWDKNLDSYSWSDECLPYAAVLAILRAHGVEILFTKETT